MKGRWRRKCPCTLAWAWLAARRRARIFWAPPDTGFARDCTSEDSWGASLSTTSAAFKRSLISVAEVSGSNFPNILELTRS